MKTYKIILLILLTFLFIKCEPETAPVDVDIAQEISREWICERQPDGMTYDVTIIKNSDEAVILKNFHNIDESAQTIAAVYSDNTIILERQELLNATIGGSARISDGYQQIDWTYYVVQEDSVNYTAVFTMSDVTKKLN